MVNDDKLLSKTFQVEGVVYLFSYFFTHIAFASSKLKKIASVAKVQPIVLKASHFAFSHSQLTREVAMRLLVWKRFIATHKTCQQIFT